jgi:hypothetical protein
VTTAAPAFRKVLTDLSKGTVLKPLMHSYLFEAEFPDLDLSFPKRDMGRRSPDGWFHPSEHVLWPERMLYWYLAEPDKVIGEPMEYMGTMSVTVGSIMHSFTQQILKHQGLLLAETELEDLGYAINSTGEPTVADVPTGARGSMDGILRLTLPKYLASPHQGFEFKTRSPLAKPIEDLDLDAYKAKHPGYWAQNQEYMRLSGLDVFVVLFMAMGYPWELTEIHVPADPFFQEQVRQKYMRVRAAEEAREMPEPPCCGPRSADAKVCPAREVCPVGRL